MINIKVFSDLFQVVLPFSKILYIVTLEKKDFVDFRSMNNYF